MHARECVSDWWYPLSAASLFEDMRAGPGLVYMAQ